MREIAVQPKVKPFTESRLNSCALHNFPANIRDMNTGTFYFWYNYFSMPLAEKG